MAYKTENQTNIYSSKGKFIASQPYPYEAWKLNPIKYFAEYEDDMIGTDKMYEYPIVENGKLREMTVEEQITSGARVLQPGEKYDPIKKEIYRIPIPTHLLRPVLNEDESAYIEGATHEELQSHVSNLVYKWKDEIYEEGFTYTRSKDGEEYHQRLRKLDADRINETITFLEQMEKIGMPTYKVRWQFNDDCIREMDIKDMRELFMHGGFYRQAGYDTMALWRNKEHYDLAVDTRENYKADFIAYYKKTVEAFKKMIG